MLRALALAVLLSAACGAGLAAELAPGDRIAFLGLAFIDTSAEGAYLGEKPEEIARIGLLEGLITRRFAEEGYPFLDNAPVAERLARESNPAKCYGCDLRMGKTLGADYVLLGEVQKVSNLILSMNLQLRDVQSGELVMGRAVDIRSNTDDSWSRGMRYILKTAFFRE